MVLRRAKQQSRARRLKRLNQIKLYYFFTPMVIGNIFFASKAAEPSAHNQENRDTRTQGTGSEDVGCPMDDV